MREKSLGTGLRVAAYTPNTFRPGQMHVALRPALLLWATALRPLPLHPLMTDSVPPVRAAAPIVSSAPKPEGSGSQLVPKVDEELLAQVSQSLPHS